MISINIGTLANRARTYAAKKQADLHNEIQDKVNDMVGDLIAESPVDRGDFKNAWDHDEINGTFVIQNQMPYGPRLARGSSSQAPDGWVDNITQRYFPR